MLNIELRGRKSIESGNLGSQVKSRKEMNKGSRKNSDGVEFPSKEVELPYSSIQAQVKFLQGKVLTILEATHPEGAQLKAMKDLVNKAFSEQLTWISQLCFPEVQMWSRDQMVASGSNVEAIEREARGAVDEGQDQA